MGLGPTSAVVTAVVGNSNQTVDEAVLGRFSADKNEIVLFGKGRLAPKDHSLEAFPALNLVFSLRLGGAARSPSAHIPLGWLVLRC